jgi:hypothetical protein
MSQPSKPLSILHPTKKLSQLIAKSWLDGTRLSLGDSKFLIENDILSDEEAKFFKIEVDDSPAPPYRGYTNIVTAKFYIPYPKRPEGVEDKDLEDWVNSPTDSPPWRPDPKTKIIVIDTHTAAKPEDT